MWTRRSQQSQTNVIRWWPIFLIGSLACGMYFVVQVCGWSLIRPGIDIQIVVGLFNLAVYVWVRAWANLRMRAQISAIALLLTAQATMLAMLRLDGFAGDGRLVLKWRWTPTPEDRFADFATRTTSDLSHANFAQTFNTDSPGFRGADRAGLYRVPGLQFDWQSNPPRELWRHPVGRGWSSFAVVGAYCVTQEQRDNFEAVVCYELGSGNEVWCHLDAARFEEYTSGSGPRATPTIYEGRVYTLGATGILNCLDGSTGSVVWTRQIGPDVSPSLFGNASSPLVSDRRVFVSPGGAAGSLIAFDCATGDLLWSEGSRKPGYSSPHLFPTQNMAQVLIFDAIGLHGHDAATGVTLWSFPWGDNSDEQVNVGQPVIVPEAMRASQAGSETHLLLISSGYGRGSALLSVARDAAGEWAAHEMWTSKALKSKFSSVVIRDNHAYGLDDGILCCIALEDGTRRWKSGRYGYGQLILVNDCLLIQAEMGSLAIVKADPHAFQEIATLKALNDRTWNQPVISGRHLLVRNDREAVCFELPVLPP